VTVVGLRSQAGKSTGDWTFVVTTQVRVTGALDPLGCTLRVAVALPLGSTAGGYSGEDTVKVNCPKATSADAAENASKSNAKTMGRKNTQRETRQRKIFLDFTMSDWELTTFDSSNGAKAARPVPKECLEPARSS
jgi:hypothetical protein